jgi:hypothetical protein
VVPFPEEAAVDASSEVAVEAVEEEAEVAVRSPLSIYRCLEMLWNDKL